MNKYLLSIYQPGDGTPPPAHVLEPIMRNVLTLHDAMKAAGVLVFTGGLHPPHTAKVVQSKAHRMLQTDGPYIETKEHLGGFTVIQVETDDAALEWARKLAEAVTLPIEVREFRH